MQTTLMGLAIALILALVTALVGPYFVNWNNYRGAFEAEATRIVGLNVRVAGDIEVNILPSPSVRLADIEIGPAGKATRLRAQSLGIEFGLGPLMRGELRAVEMRLKSPQLSLGLNSLGRVDWPSMALAGETLSIDRLSIDDGRVILTDEVSGTRLALENLKFVGAVRSLTGPFRGDGTFKASGATYAYRIASSRFGDDGAKLKLAIDDSERPVNAELEGLLAFEQGAPRFNGSLKLLRPAGVVQASGRVVAQEPWVLTGRLTATSQMALVEQVMFQYGPEERAATLTGTAEFKFGERPQLQGVLSARQIDFDRLMATSQLPRQPPLAAVRNVADLFGVAIKPTFATSVTVSIDAATLGGAQVQNIGADVRTDGQTWRLEKLEFRAPGFAQVKLSGRLDHLATGLGFAGALDVEASDPRMLIAWLVGRSGVAPQIKPLRLRGELALGADRIALDQLQASFDRGTLEGRLAYSWSTAVKPARLDAELIAGELDLDTMLQSGKAALAGLALEWPREVVLGLDIERAKVVGFEARKVQARLKFDAQGIAIERLSVADFGNAKIDASGRLATTPNPAGNITADIDARDLKGVTALVERFAPALLGPLQRLAGTENSAKLRLTIGLDNAGTGKAIGKLVAAGQIGAFRFDIKAGATGKPADFVPPDWSGLGLTDTRFEVRLESDDGNALLALLGLNRFAVPGTRPARLGIAATQPLRGEWRIDGALAAGPIDAKGKGKVRLRDDAPLTVELDQLSGTIATSPMRGALAITLAEATRVEGKIEIETLDVPTAIAAALGMPRRNAGDPHGPWSSEPFANRGSELVGRIQINAQRAALSPTLIAKQASGVLRFGPSEITVDEIASELASGRLDGRLAFVVGRDGVTMQARVAISQADAAALVPTGDRTPVAGKLSFRAEVTGTGLSPAAFIGSIAGAGYVTLEDGQLSGLNPRVFDAVIRAADLGIPTDVNRIRDFVASSLDTGNFLVKRTEASVAIKDGRLRLADVTLSNSGTDLSVIAAVDLVNFDLYAAMTLSGLAAEGDNIRPTVFVTLKGPLLKPARSVAADALASWLTLRAVEAQSKQLSILSRPATPIETTPSAADVTSALPVPAAAPPEIDVGVNLPVERAPPLPPAVTVLPAPRPNPDNATHPPRPTLRKPAATAPGRPLDLLGAQR